jgi:digeranylgeranylglycerophospholipid reductase
MASNFFNVNDAPLTADVLIAGGGPAGLAAASAAARTGARTIVFERRKEIGYPIHTSGGSWIADMEALHIPSTLYHPIRRITFLSPNNEANFDYNNPVCCVLDVRGVYQHLAGQAVRDGAIIQPASPVEAPIVENDRVVGLRAKNAMNKLQEWRAPVTIDCTGFSSALAARVGLHGGYRRYGYGAEWDLLAPNYPDDLLYLIVGSHVAPSGYAWVFPRGNGRVRVGVGVIRPDVNDDARLYLHTFVERLPQLAPVFAGASPIEYHVGLFPSEGMMQHFVYDGLVTAGDSGGHGSTLVGEGIRFAIYAGQLAGGIAGKAALANTTSAETLSEFDRAWRAKFGRNLDIALLINKHIAAYADQQWDEKIELLKHFTPELAAQAVRGDFSAKLIFDIIRRNPSLLRDGPRSFVKKILFKLADGGKKSGGVEEKEEDTSNLSSLDPFLEESIVNELMR